MPTDMVKNLDRFMEAYARELQVAVEAHPEMFAYGSADVPVVLARMRAAVVRGSFSHDGLAFRNTCKALGIKLTRRAIVSFLAGDAS
jgi:hypothetical protein